MKAKVAFLFTSGLLLVTTPVVRAQITNTNALPLAQTLKYQIALEGDRSLGERSLLPPGLKEKMKLTNEQRADLKPIEDDFAKTSMEYQTANQPRIDAALDANRSARATKSATQIEAARNQLQRVWAGLQPDRTAAVKQIRPFLTPDQIAVLDAPDNQWRENHESEVNDPSAH